MDVVRLTERLCQLRFPVGHCYLWRDPDGLTLIDSGVPGSASEIADGIRRLGHDPTDVRRLLITHGHVDHIGGAAEIASWGDVEILAHRADAPVIRGVVAAPPPVLSDWERPILAAVEAELPAAAPAPVRVDTELTDGDVVDIGGGTRVISVPGHTAGSIALYLPAWRVLFTGDVMARDPASTDPATPVIPGIFNVDSAGVAADIRRLATLDVEIACFGHGLPVTSGAGDLIRQLAGRLGAAAGS